MNVLVRYSIWRWRNWLYGKRWKSYPSVYGTIIYGKVIGLKPGTGNAASRLTIVTLNEINENGQIVGGHYIKVLFWNSKNGKQKLSDRARKLKSGDLISCRVVFDAGIHSKAVGFEFKRSAYIHLLERWAKNIYFTWSCRKSDSREKWILRDICPYKTISKRKFSNRLVSRILF